MGKDLKGNELGNFDIKEPSGIANDSKSNTLWTLTNNYLVRGKFQLGKLRIGNKFQLLDNVLRQFPQGSFIRHQVALHQPQFVDKPQPGAGVVEHHQHEFLVVKVHGHPSLSGRRWDCTPGHRTFP